MWYHARWRTISARQIKVADSRGWASRITLPCVDRASSSMISQDRTAFFLPRISGMVLFLSRVVGGILVWITACVHGAWRRVVHALVTRVTHRKELHQMAALGGRPTRSFWAIPFNCNRRNFRTRKISYSSVRGLPYATNFCTAWAVLHTLAYVYGFRILQNFELSAKSTKNTKLTLYGRISQQKVGFRTQKAISQRQQALSPQ